MSDSLRNNDQRGRLCVLLQLEKSMPIDREERNLMHRVLTDHFQRYNLLRYICFKNHSHSFIKFFSFQVIFQIRSHIMLFEQTLSIVILIYKFHFYSRESDSSVRVKIVSLLPILCPSRLDELSGFVASSSSETSHVVKAALMDAIAAVGEHAMKTEDRLTHNGCLRYL